MKTINIASEFSRHPAGRFRSDGPYSGQRFREDVLLKIMREGELVSIELNGTRGYGSSFLEEAFGGLVRQGYQPEQIKKTIKFVGDNQLLIDEIIFYIEDAVS